MVSPARWGQDGIFSWLFHHFIRQAASGWWSTWQASWWIGKEPASIHSTGLLVHLVSESSSAAGTLYSAFTQDTKTSYPVPIPTGISIYLFFICLSMTDAYIWFFLNPWAFDQLVRHCPWIRIKSIPVSYLFVEAKWTTRCPMGIFPFPLPFRDIPDWSHDVSAIHFQLVPAYCAEPLHEALTLSSSVS